MARRLATRLARALTTQWTDPGYHFHGGAQGAYVCHDPKCTSPRLAAHDA
jgi:hypothetical protein